MPAPDLRPRSLAYRSR